MYGGNTKTIAIPIYTVLPYCVMLWKENGIIEDKHLTLVQDLVDKFVTPADVGRIPRKITSGFASFTADQWKNWTLISRKLHLKQFSLMIIIAVGMHLLWHVI